MVRLKSAEMKKKTPAAVGSDAWSARIWFLYVTYQGSLDEGLDAAIRGAVSAACDGVPQPATWLRRVRVGPTDYDVASRVRRAIYELPNRSVAQECASAADAAAKVFIASAKSIKGKGRATDVKTSITDGSTLVRMDGGKAEAVAEPAIKADWHLHVTYEGNINPSLDAAVRRAVKDECIDIGACESDYDAKNSERSLYISVPTAAGEQCAIAAVRAYKDFLSAHRAAKSRVAKPTNFQAGIGGMFQVRRPDLEADRPEVETPAESVKAPPEPAKAKEDEKSVRPLPQPPAPPPQPAQIHPPLDIPLLFQPTVLPSPKKTPYGKIATQLAAVSTPLSNRSVSVWGRASVVMVPPEPNQASQPQREARLLKRRESMSPAEKERYDHGLRRWSDANAAKRPRRPR